MLRQATAISVVMTTCQGERHLQHQLETILGQSILPNEMVVSDDASTDRTWEILTRFADDAAFPVVMLRNPVRLGLRANVERALSASSGEIVVLADQDDTWAPTKVEKLASAFQDPAVMMWFSDAQLIDAQGAETGGTAWAAVNFSRADQDSVREGAGLRRLLHGMTVTGATMACRADVVGLALPLPRELEGPDHLFLHDGWLAVLADIRGRVVAEPEPLTGYRQHPHQLTAMSMSSAGAAPTGAGRSTNAWRHLRHPAPSDSAQLDLARTRLVAQRLRDSQAMDACRPEAVRQLLNLEEFLTVRVLPRETRGRRSQVVQQLMRGRYSQYARGVWTAALDLL